MSTFDGDSWPCFMWIAIGAIVCCSIITGVRELNYQHELDLKAIESGLVQKVVKVDGEFSKVIWTKVDSKDDIILEKRNERSD